MTIHDCLHPSYLAVINTFSFCQLLIAVCMQTVCTCEHLLTLISVFCAQCLVLCVLALFVLDQQIFFLISSFPTIDIFILLGEIWHMFYMCTQPAFYHVNVRCNPGLHITHTLQYTFKGNITLTLCISPHSFEDCLCMYTEMLPLCKWAYTSRQHIHM